MQSTISWPHISHMYFRTIIIVIRAAANCLCCILFISVGLCAQHYCVHNFNFRCIFSTSNRYFSSHWRICHHSTESQRSWWWIKHCSSWHYIRPTLQIYRYEHIWLLNCLGDKQHLTLLNSIDIYRACLWVSRNALFWKSQTHSVNDSIYNFDWVFLEIPVKNCMVRMLLTGPIDSVLIIFSH